MIRSVLLLVALVSVSTTLQCYSCGIVHKQQTELQKVSFKRVIEKLRMGPCKRDSYKECNVREDECQRVDVESKLGDLAAEPVSATVYKCGQSRKREKLCRTLKLSGQLLARVHLDYCQAQACRGDKCFIPYSDDIAV